MAPEYGATCGFFPVDTDTLSYLRPPAATPRAWRWSKAYAEAQGMFRTADSPDPVFTDTLELDLTTVVPSCPAPSVRRTGCRS